MFEELEEFFAVSYPSERLQELGKLLPPAIPKASKGRMLLRERYVQTSESRHPANLVRQSA